MPLRRNGDAVSPERGVRFAGTRVRSGVDGVPSHPTATQTPAATGTRGSTNGFVFHPLGENGKSTSPLKTKVAAPIPAFQLLFLGLRFRGHLKKDPHAHATPCHMRGGCRRAGQPRDHIRGNVFYPGRAHLSAPTGGERESSPFCISCTEENAATIISSWGIDLTDGAGEGNRTLVRSLGSSYSAIELRPPGGERGIRTPDTLAGMHDFESCAFNQALPSLQNGT